MLRTSSSRALLFAAGAIAAWIAEHSLPLGIISTTLTVGPGCSPPPPPPPTTTVIVYGVTPAEISLPSTEGAYIKGRGLNLAGITVQLVDPADPTFAPVALSKDQPTPHSLHVSIPTFVTSRKRYRLKLTQNNATAADAVPGKSSYLYLSNGGAPASEKINIQYINWGWSIECGDGGGYRPHGTTRRNSGIMQNGNCRDDGGFPNDYPPFPPGIWPQAGTDNPNDGVWLEWTRFAEQSSRDWATVCTQSWNAGSTNLIGGFNEVAPKITLIHSLMFWFNLTAGTNIPSLQAKALLHHRIYDKHPCPASTQSFCEHLSSEPRPGNWDATNQRRWYGCDEVYYSEDDEIHGEQQPACQYYPDLLSDSSPGSPLPHPSPPRIEVHLIGMFFENNACVDPSDVTKFRAVTNPTGPHSGSYTILISDNKDCVGRLHPDKNNYGQQAGLIHPWPYPNNGNISTLAGNTHQGWWGPDDSDGFPPDDDNDGTPNALSHEIFHALTGWTDPDPKAKRDTPLVDLDESECALLGNPAPCSEEAERRGFSMDFTGATGDQTCSLAVATGVTQ